LKNIPIEPSTDIFHTRGELPAFFLLRIFKNNKINILADIRGTSVEEVKYYFNQNPLLKHFKIINYKKALKSLSKVSMITAVSDTLRKYLISEFRIDENKIVVIPSLAGDEFSFSDDTRKIMRKKMGFNEHDLVFIFTSGGYANWQKNEILHSIPLREFKVINLSKMDLKGANILNRFVTYEEVPDYLCAADIALIWRDDNIVNRVASPVKFSEYICSGLPVVSNPPVESVAGFIKGNHVGCTIGKPEELTEPEINKLLKLSRTDISEIGRKYFSSSVVSNKYLNIYKSFDYK
ncbi:glycosyltransferase, partial [Bacteroidota bacterium]